MSSQKDYGTFQHHNTQTAKFKAQLRFMFMVLKIGPLKAETDKMD